MNKQELIAQIQTARAWIEAMLAELSEEQIETEGVQGDWSVKDVIAHLTTWERRGTEWIRSIVQGEEPQVPLPGHSWQDLERLNQETYQQNRHRPWQDVLAEFQGAFPPLMEQLQALAEEQLDETFQAEWTGGQVVTARQVVAWRYMHYRSHGRHIQDWLEALK
jgi:hypothetical protein